VQLARQLSSAERHVTIMCQCGSHEQVTGLPATEPVQRVMIK
jgi:hypothetical protein